ncbi:MULTISPECIES: hypothetical protein [Paenibacillus]|uniref:hypothetical protein n=1 Tax=Paenibacillus TaxID=44249 RepID=UPI0022B8C632|nr:hypothetical protein [Paenibacillus caseinilyticus]MCZ8522552.1 hypothetical protein [Paenibacillus caseinilyticus]
MKEVKVTPDTTSVTHSLEQFTPSQLVEKQKQEQEFIYTKAAVHEDQGHLLERLSGEGKRRAAG